MLVLSTFTLALCILAFSFAFSLAFALLGLGLGTGFGCCLAFAVLLPRGLAIGVLAAAWAGAFAGAVLSGAAGDAAKDQRVVRGVRGEAFVHEPARNSAFAFALLFPVATSSRPGGRVATHALALRVDRGCCRSRLLLLWFWLDGCCGGGLSGCGSGCGGPLFVRLIFPFCPGFSSVCEGKAGVLTGAAHGAHVLELCVRKGVDASEPRLGENMRVAMLLLIGGPTQPELEVVHLLEDCGVYAPSASVEQIYARKRHLDLR